jgi:serine/threonine-protein kinase
MDLGLSEQIGKTSKKTASMGTPYYMAPELIQSPEEADQRADMYALGVSFYRMLTGQYPITGSDAREIIKNITEQIPKNLPEIDPSISGEMDKIVQKMIAKKPADRYPHMTALLTDLDRILLVE